LINSLPSSVSFVLDSSLSKLSPAPLVLDCNYLPRQTELMKQANSFGWKAIGGIELLIAQGLAQFQLWTGRTSPHNLMEKIVREEFDRK